MGTWPTCEAKYEPGSATHSAGPAYVQAAVKMRSRSSAKTASSEYHDAGSVQPSSRGSGTWRSARVVAILILTVVSVRILGVQGVEQGASAETAGAGRVDAILRAACRVVVRDGAS